MKYKKYVLPKTKRQHALNKGFLLKILQVPLATQNLLKSHLPASQSHFKKGREEIINPYLLGENGKTSWQDICMTCELRVSHPLKVRCHGGREAENGRLVSVLCECSCPLALKPSDKAWKTWKTATFNASKTYKRTFNLWIWSNYRSMCVSSKVVTKSDVIIDNPTWLIIHKDYPCVIFSL